MRGVTTSNRVPHLTLSKATGWLLLFSLALTFSGSAYSQQRYSAVYDRAIAASVNEWLPWYPSWKRAKAQLVAESNLRSDVCSQVGACGLAQFMPATWAEVSGKEDRLRFDPGLSIEYYGRYMARLARNWKTPRPLEDKISLSESSYNAGLGWILKAQRLCNGAALWDEIVRCLPDVTGHHSRETIGYTLRIRRVWKELEAR